MKTFVLSLFLVGATLSAAPITAQVQLVNAGNPAVSDGHYYVSPYTLAVDGTNFAALCIDFRDESTIGNTWQAYISPLNGDISHTYLQDLTAYQKEAYLFSLITQPSADRVNIQHAAWSITDPFYSADSAAQTYLDLANSNFSSMSFSGYEIVSSVDSPHQQEFMIYNASAAPEPATLPLLAGGLLVGAALALRSRRKRLMSRS